MPPVQMETISVLILTCLWRPATIVYSKGLDFFYSYFYSFTAKLQLSSCQ